MAIAEELTIKSLESVVHPDWCPGCGDFGVLKSLKEALVQLEIQPHNVLVVSGIGCSSNLPGFINAYGVHSLHGRALPVATGAALASIRAFRLIFKAIICGGWLQTRAASCGGERGRTSIDRGFLWPPRLSTSNSNRFLQNNLLDGATKSPPAT